MFDWERKLIIEDCGEEAFTTADSKFLFPVLDEEIDESPSNKSILVPSNLESKLPKSKNWFREFDGRLAFCLALLCSSLIWNWQNYKTIELANAEYTRQHDRSGTLSRLHGEVFRDLDEAMDLFESHVSIFPEDRQNLLFFPVKILNTCDVLTPRVEKFAETWEGEIRQDLNPMNQLSWYNRLSELNAKAGNTKKAHYYRMIGYDAMVKIDKEKWDEWNVGYINEIADQLRADGQFKEIKRVTNPLADSPTKWLERGALNGLLHRCSALYHFGELNEALNLMKILTSDEFVYSLSDGLKIDVYAGAAKFFDEAGHSEPAAEYLRLAETVLQGIPFEKRLQEEAAIRSVYSHKYQKINDFKATIAATMNIDAWLNDPSTGRGPGYKHIVVGLGASRMEAQIAEGDLESAKLLNEKLTRFIDQWKVSSVETSINEIRTKLFALSGESTKAIEIATRSIELTMDDGSVMVKSRISNLHFFKGFAEANLGDYFQAAKDFEVAKSYAQNIQFETECKFNLGICFLNIEGMKESGEKLLQATIEDLSIDEQVQARELKSENKLLVKSYLKTSFEPGG